MSVYCIVNAQQKLHDRTRKIFLNEPLMYDNARAHCFRLYLTDDDGNTPADLSGASVTAAFLRPDNVTVYITDGTITGNMVEVILSDDCYSAAGRYKLTVNLTESGNETVRTALIVEGITERNISDSTVIPDSTISSIDDLIEDINTARASVPTDYSDLLATIAPDFDDTTAYARGQFVWYDQVLYQFVADHAAGSWSESDATAVTINGEIENLADRLNNSGLLIDYGYRDALSSSTNFGITYYRRGTHIKINGTESETGNARIRMSGGLRINATAVRQNQSIAGTGANVKANRTYRVTSRLVAGAVDFSQATNSPYTQLAYTYANGSSSTNADSPGGDVVRGTDGSATRIFTVPSDSEVTVWLCIYKNTVFTNAEYEILLEDITDSIAPDAIAPVEKAVAASTHTTGSLIMSGGKLYKATSNIAVGDTIATYASATTVADELEDITSDIDEVRTNIAPLNWTEASQDYSVGDLLMLNGLLYVAVEPITEGTTLVEDVNIEQTSVARVLSSLSARITALGG